MLFLKELMFLPWLQYANELFGAISIFLLTIFWICWGPLKNSSIEKKNWLTACKSVQSSVSLLVRQSCVTFEWQKSRFWRWCNFKWPTTKMKTKLIISWWRRSDVPPRNLLLFKNNTGQTDWRIDWWTLQLTLYFDWPLMMGVCQTWLLFSFLTTHCCCCWRWCQK